MITSIHFGRDIHTADENHIFYAMNNDLIEAQDTALRYGFVDHCIAKGLLENLTNPSAEMGVLGNIIHSKGQRGPTDGINRDYHGIVCHSILDEPYREHSPKIIKSIFDQYADKNVASLIMGSGLMGQCGGADVKKILQAMQESAANISLYTMEPADIASPAMQMALKRSNIKYNLNKEGLAILAGEDLEHKY